MIPTKELKKLRAFHKDPEIKAKYLKRVFDHEKADEIIKGVYWENGKGCAVGCTIEGDDHKRYETELGIPEAIAWLEDFLFERLENGDAKTFPRRFLEAIPVGAKLYNVAPKFIVFVLKDVLQYCGSDENCKKAIVRVARLWERVVRGDVPKQPAWSAAENAARNAAESAARNAAWNAAESAAEIAARNAAENAAIKKYADKLIALLQESGKPARKIARKRVKKQ